jgi:RNAse (barnase) inhibitor barstar
MKLELKKFNPQEMKQDAVCVFIGKRRSGKSFCLKDILSNNCDFPIGIVLSGSEICNQFFQKFIPNILIYDEYKPEIIKRFLDRQIKVTKQRADEIKKYGRSDIDPRAFIILDDVLYDKTWQNDKNIRSILMNGRHYSILTIITSQMPLGINPALRSQIDYVFIFKNNIIKEREKIYNHYAGICNSFEVFNKIMDSTTENFEVMVIDNTTQNNSITDQIKWYKATEKNFKMCSQELWNLCALEEQRQQNRLFYDNAEEEDEEEFNPNAFIKNSNKIKLSVKKKI